VVTSHRFPWSVWVTSGVSISREITLFLDSDKWHSRVKFNALSHITSSFLVFSVTLGASLSLSLSLCSFFWIYGTSRPPRVTNPSLVFTDWNSVVCNKEVLTYCYRFILLCSLKCCNPFFSYKAFVVAVAKAVQLQNKGKCRFSPLYLCASIFHEKIKSTLDILIW